MKILVTILVVLLPLISYSLSLNLYQLAKDEWHTFKSIHGKSYTSEVEERFRMKIYLENRLKIAKYNKRRSSYSMEMNSFGDQLPHEFASTQNGFRMDLLNKTRRFSSGTFITPAHVKVPDYIDWREKGAVTPVKNQNSCGSCYAFSASGALEGQHFRKTGKLISLSEQNIVDCTKNGKYGNEGCSGGLMDNSFNYIRDNQGIDTETGYPYEALEGSCRYRTDDIGADDKGAIDIPQGDEQKLMEAVATVGPISIAIDAGHETFQFYKKGIYYEKQCSPTQLDHGVLIVGYGTEDGADYWLVKNSWGPEWGDEGYIKIARNRDNHCGVASLASYPLV